MVLSSVYFAAFYMNLIFYTTATITSNKNKSKEKSELLTKHPVSTLVSENRSIYLQIGSAENKVINYSTSSNDSVKMKNSNKIANTVHKTNCDNTAAVNISCGTLEYIGCTGTKQFFQEATVKSSWFEAWEFCRSKEMHLAAIESRYEQSFLEIFLEKPDALTETYWTSGTRFAGPFTWMATGKLITYVNWRAGEPNNRYRNELCVEIVTKSTTDFLFWNDQTCNSLGYALCQKDLIGEK